MTAQLATVCVARAETIGSADAVDPLDRPWRSAIRKAPVAGPVRVHRTGLAGDEQADTRVHGGPEKAVLAYAVDHYAAWAAELGPMPGHGAFGENLAIRGFDEATVAIGDVLAIGTARLQVAQPRAPCWKLARTLRRPEIVELVIRHGRTGWYLRVLQEGSLTAGDPVARVEHPHPDLTLASLHQVLYGESFDRVLASGFADCAELTEGIRDRVAHRLGR